MPEFNFSYNGKKFSIEVKECRTIFQKMMGLMFLKESKPLLFVFKKKTYEPIHSFFCVNFIAVWFDKDRIVDARLVKPWKISVKSLRQFDKLLEIPQNDKNFERLVLLIKK
jgi:uncharacterized membrane protein (UPF0127 family)